MAISPQRLTIYLYSEHRAVVFAIAQLSSWAYGTFVKSGSIYINPRQFYTSSNKFHQQKCVILISFSVNSSKTVPSLLGVLILLQILHDCQKLEGVTDIFPQWGAKFLDRSIFWSSLNDNGCKSQVVGVCVSTQFVDGNKYFLQTRYN